MIWAVLYSFTFNLCTNTNRGLFAHIFRYLPVSTLVRNVIICVKTQVILDV